MGERTPSPARLDSFACNFHTPESTVVMNNFNFNNIAYNAVDVSARLDNTVTSIYPPNGHVSLDTLGLGATDGKSGSGYEYS